MSTTPIIAIILHLLIALIQSQRVTLLSQSFTSHETGWFEENLSGPYNGYFSDGVLCPLAICYVFSNQDRFYRYIDTTGYKDIQIAYDIQLMSGVSLEFWWIRGTAAVGYPGWVHQSTHNTCVGYTCNILHTSLLSTELDNADSVGIAFYMNSYGWTHLNNVVITGISTRVTLLSSTFIDYNAGGYADGWIEENLSGTYNGYFTSSNCPSGVACCVQSNQDHFYRYIDTRGYTDIQVAYQITTTNMNTGEGIEFLWIRGTAGVGYPGWVHEARLNCDAVMCDMLHTALSSDLDNTESIGIDFWMDSGPGAWSHLNNVLVTGVPITYTTAPSANPTAKPTVKPTSNPTPKPTLQPTANPTLRPTVQPTVQPTDNPTPKPTTNPTSNPAVFSDQPTKNPTQLPTGITPPPSYAPSTDEPTVQGESTSPSPSSTDPDIVQETGETIETVAPTKGSGRNVMNDVVSTTVIGILGGLLACCVCSIMCLLQRLYKQRSLSVKMINIGSISNVVAVDADIGTMRDEREQVISWLTNQVKLPQYANAFVNQGYDSMRAIQAIENIESLALAGVKAPGHRTLIMYEIKELQSKTDLPAPQLQMERGPSYPANVNYEQTLPPPPSPPTQTAVAMESDSEILDMVCTQGGTNGGDHDLNEYQNNSNIGEDEFIVNNDENIEYELQQHTTRY
eukprot:201333_1